MSGNSYRRREGDWRCDRCNNSNFAWRTQCNRCHTARNEDGGLGMGTALLVGAGAAAVGFLAQGLWNAFQGTSASSSAPTPPPPAADLGARKKYRDSFKDQNIPDELKCAICLTNPREVCMLPCGHVCLCEDCAEKVTIKCPLCQQRIESKKAVYL